MVIITDQSIKEKLQEVVKKIVDKYQPEKIILFGSYAWGNPHEESDIDLFIVKETNNTREMARKIDSTIFPREFPIDFMIYRPDDYNKRIQSGDIFINEIFNKGKILYERQSL